MGDYEQFPRGVLDRDPDTIQRELTPSGCRSVGLVGII